MTTLREIMAMGRAQKKSASQKPEEITIQEDSFEKAISTKEDSSPPTTGFIYDSKMLLHSSSSSKHIECPDRLKRSYDRCSELGLLKRCRQIPSRPATNEELLRVHDKSLIDAVEAQNDLSKFESVFSNEFTAEVARLASGSAVELTSAVVNGNVSNGFAFLRPPGHHASKMQCSGFCIYNNVAIAAKHARDVLGVQRILIADLDTHHGHGTQQEFINDSEILYFSIHKYGFGRFWPHLKESNFNVIGNGSGTGFNVNVPLNSTKVGDADYMAIFHQILMPIAYEYQPQLVLVSLGIDAGCSDGEVVATPACYGHMIRSLMTLAGGKVVVLLEGGYFLDSLEEGVAMTIRALLGDPCVSLGALSNLSPSLADSILNVLFVLSDRWKHLNLIEKCENEENNKGQGNKLFIPNLIFLHDVSKNVFKMSKGYLQGDGFVYISDEELKHFSERMNEMKSLYEKHLITSNDLIYVYDEIMMKHKNERDESHPECPERIQRIFQTHESFGLLPQMRKVESRRIEDDEIANIHDQTHKKYFAELKNLGNQEEFDKFASGFDSIYLNEFSSDSALLAAGSLLNVVDEVCSDKARRGIAMIRPPGHHAEKECFMGFCLLNNVALAAAHAQIAHKLERILILDWDIHHGNGIQNCFFDNPNVLYISIHRHDNGNFFPKGPEGGADFVGIRKGEGFNVNIPWNGGPGIGDPEYLAAFFNIIMPVAYEFDPQLVLVSAGFDAAVNDPLGNYKVSPQMYGHMTHHLSKLANGKIIVVLEGGYNLQSISLSMTMCTKALLGHSLPMPNTQDAPKETAVDDIRKVISIQEKYWKSLQLNNCKFPKKISAEEAATEAALRHLSIHKAEEYTPNEYGSHSVTSFINTMSSSSSIKFSTISCNSKPYK